MQTGITESFDYAPWSCAEHAIEQALAQYADPRSWDIDGNWIGHGDGPEIAKEAMQANLPVI